VRETADPEIVVEQTRAADFFEEIEDAFAVLEQQQKGRERADVDAVRADGDLMAGDALQLRHDDADVVDALGHLDLQELLGGDDVGEFVAHRRHIIHAVNVRYDLLVVRHLFRVFSKQRWRYPRCGITSTTISPSTTSSSLSTPCVDGCCGPMLRIISSVRRVVPRDVAG